MSATRIDSTEVKPGFQLRKPEPVKVEPGYTGRHRLDGRRVGLAGGISLLVFYSLRIVLLVVLGYPPWSGMLQFWEELLPGFDGSSSRGIALGFPLAFLYGAGGAWLFAMIYNIAPARISVGSETS
ncbi:MAG TPA: hypothetical protein VFU40_00280 [Gemmatimonadales bacterium]|nr:hypothetical protein [Gemmatimonadales bacterium]